MLKNYLKISIRNILNNKLYTFIYVLGLALGITGFTLIYLYVNHELSYDKYLHPEEKVYRLINQNSESAFLTPNYAEILKEQFPEFKKITRIKSLKNVVTDVDQNNSREDHFFYAEPEVFDIFNLSFQIGNSKTALSQNNNVVLTKEMAEKYFRKENPLGKNINIYTNAEGEEAQTFVVSGVLDAREVPSHFNFDFLIPFSRLGEVGTKAQFRGIGWTYALLNRETDLEILSAKVNEHLNSPELKNIVNPFRGEFDLFFQPVSKIHLYSNMNAEISANNDIRNIYIFSAIAILILLTASINYMNLTTARSITKAKETGIRKVLGSDRLQLTTRFFTESLLIAVLAAALSLLSFELILPFFNNMLGMSLSVNYEIVLPSLLVIILLVTLMAGLYPSVVLSSFKPSESLQGKAKGSRNNLFWNGLSVFQFSISAGLIICTLIIHQQMSFVQTKDLGYQKDHIISFELNDKNIKANKELLAERISDLSYVQEVSLATNNPADMSYGNSKDSYVLENGSSIAVNTGLIGLNFFETMNIEIIRGRTPEESDSFQGNSVVINKAFADQIGWDNPIGKIIKSEENPDFQKTIIGVVDNFHISSLKEEIIPTVFYYEPRLINNILVRTDGTNITAALDHIEQVWAEFAPYRPFEFEFVEDRVALAYAQDKLVYRLLLTFTIVSIFISCLGLIGLSAYYAHNRTKEIGVRKVLGASVKDITLLLSKDFIKLVAMGFFVVSPIAWYVMNTWLTEFAYRIDLGTGIFILAGVITIVLATGTISWQTIKAAITNPVESLRSE